MKKRKLGAGDLDVSVMGLGCLEFGSRMGRDDSFAVLDAYFEAGGRFLDTANNYSFWVEGCLGGESETLLGEWMRERRNRHELVLATKVGARPTVVGAGLEAAEGLGQAAIASAIEGSLRRLGVDCVDLYYAHVEDPRVPQAETLDAFERLRAQGKVREIGCSNHSVSRLEEARALGRVAGRDPYRAWQQRFGWLEPRPGSDLGVQKLADASVREHVSRHPDVTLVAYSVLLGGAYAGGAVPAAYDTPANAARLLRLNGLSARLGIGPASLVLAWVMERGQAIPLVASRTPERLREYLGACEVALASDVLDEMGAIRES